MIVETAISYIGTPFEHQGRKPFVGLDCVGCLVCAAKANGIDLQDFVLYGREANSKELLRRLLLDFVPVKREDIKKDDVILFWVVNKDHPQHVAIYDGFGNIVHAYDRRTKSISKVTHESLIGKWEKKIHSIWRFKVLA